MKQNSYACDNCGKSREKDANHWFLLMGSPNHNASISRWGQMADDQRMHHACGQECAFAMLARFIATGSFDRLTVRRDPSSVTAGSGLASSSDAKEEPCRFSE